MIYQACFGDVLVCFGDVQKHILIYTICYADSLRMQYLHKSPKGSKVLLGHLCHSHMFCFLRHGPSRRGALLLAVTDVRSLFTAALLRG